MGRKIKGRTILETEAKFIVPGEPTFTRLREVERFGPYEKRDEKIKNYHDRYVDTPDHSFYHKQLYVRLRESKEGDILLTIKRLGAPPEGAIHARDEYQVEVPSLARAEWPASEVRDMVEEVAGEQPLSDLVGIDQERTVSNLYQGERAVAELSLDAVTIQTAHEPVTIYELEAELLPEGMTSDLRILERILSEQYGLAPQPLTKFERAMMMADTDTPYSNGSNGPTTSKRRRKKRTNESADAASPSANGHNEPLLESGLNEPAAVVAGTGDMGASTRNLSAERAPTIPVSSPEKEPEAPSKPEDKKQLKLQRTDTADTASRKIIGPYFDAMLSKEEGAVEGSDPEAVHDMRVATRRMRSALRVLEPYLREGPPSEVRRGLKAVAQSLGAVRDLDVLIEHAEKFRDDLSEEEQGDLDGLLDSWKSNRDRARKRLLRLLESKDYGRFKERLAKFVEQHEKAARSKQHVTELEPYQVRHIAPIAILTRYESVRSFEALASGDEGRKTKEEGSSDGETPRASASAGAPTIEQLHALRISGKYLRYTLECFRETLPGEATTLIRDVTTMQDQLGALHDADVASGLIEDYVAGERKRQKKAGSEYAVPPGLAAYVEERQAAIRNIHTDFSSTWAKLQSPEWRAKLSVVLLA